VILAAKWVVPVSAPPIRDGTVQIEGDRIVALGPGASATPPSEPVVDLGDAILTPGLVNPHTHLELTGYVGRLTPAPLWTWFSQLIKLRQAAGQIEREQQGVQDGAWQSLRAGVTCVGDISRRNLNWPVLKRISIRKVCYAELLTLADDPPRNPEELRAALDEIEEDRLLTAGITPHAPYTVPAAHIRAAVELATARRRPWCAHWAETHEECAFLRGDVNALPSFMRQLLAQCHLDSPHLPAGELLEQCSRGLPPGLLAHFNYAAPGDAQRLARAGHVVVYCPRSHWFFRHPPHPYRDFLRAGVTVALGTDSLASNDNLNLLEEVRFVWRGTPDPPPPETLFRMVTLDAARALGLEAQIGSLEAGKQADLAAFPCSPGVSDPVAELVNRAPPPQGVWVAGQRVVL
jgi:cytosine/adenosine deaminase-related metal-dependent hydrolase